MFTDSILSIQQKNVDFSKFFKWFISTGLIIVSETWSSGYFLKFISLFFSWRIVIKSNWSLWGTSIKILIWRSMTAITRSIVGAINSVHFELFHITAIPCYSHESIQIIMPHFLVFILDAYTKNPLEDEKKSTIVFGKLCVLLWKMRFWKIPSSIVEWLIHALFFGWWMIIMFWSRPSKYYYYVDMVNCSIS